MYKHTMYVNGTVITGIITALAISSLLTTNFVWASASDGSATQGKGVSCNDDTIHDRNWCDGYALGITDCEDNNENRQHDKHHTKKWRDGYTQGWRQAGC